MKANENTEQDGRDHGGTGLFRAVLCTRFSGVPHLDLAFAYGAKL